MFETFVKMADILHVDENDGKQRLKLGTNTIDKVIFQAFNNLINQNSIVRVNNGAILLQKLVKNDDVEKNEYQLKYSLKRLIRGVGSSTSASRSGFFTTLVGFFKVIDNVNIEEVYDIINKELRVGAGTSENDKIDSHANTGRILVCGALIRSEKLLSLSDEHITKCVDILLKSSKFRKFHTSLAYSFLIELMRKLKKHQFKGIMWPDMIKELKRPWPKQNLDTLYFLLTAEEIFPMVVCKTISTFLNTNQIFSEDTFLQLSEILWNNENTLSNINHPVYDILSRRISNSNNLLKFWMKHVDGRLKDCSKINEIITIKFLTVIFNNSNHKLIDLSKLLSKNLVPIIIARFKNNSNNNTNKKKTPSNDGFILEFYSDFFDSIIEYIKRKTKNDKEETGKIDFIQNLILNPGYLMFDRLCSLEIISNIILLLNQNEVEELIEIFKNIVVCKTEKNNNGETWLNSERIYSLQIINKLLNHSTILKDTEWRTEQIKFILNLTIFKTSDGYQLIKGGNDDCVEALQLASLKNQLYHSLDIKFLQFDDEYKLLKNLIEYCNNILSNKNGNRYLKTSLTEDGLRAWNDMYKSVNSRKKMKLNNNIGIVFHILLLHMALQLFNDEKIAISAIEELDSCIKRVKSKKNENDEPEWIEVVVDLFLHLLSQNSSLLRHLLTKLFPKLCTNLTLSSVHQILSVLDMSENHNPLIDDNEVDGEESDQESDENSDDDNDEENDDEEDEDSIMEEEGTVSDQLRSAVTHALIGSSGYTSDQESIDLDDLNDDDANKLDNALSQAFKMFSEKRSTSSKKKTKKDKIIETTTLHFRLRVLDLIESYLKSSELNMYFLLDIMTTIFDMLNFSLKESGPLLVKIQNVLNKLTSIKIFHNTNDVTVDSLVKCFKNLIDTKFSLIALVERNLYLSKCGMFIITCSEVICKNLTDKSKITNMFKEYLIEFIQSRNPKLSLNMFTSIFINQQWDGIWDLIAVILEKGINSVKIQSIRRSQIIGLFIKLYKNYRFINIDLKTSKIKLNKIENDILNYINLNKDKITQKLFGEILELLIEIHKCHRKIPELQSPINWKSITEEIQNIRRNLILETANNSYRKFCQFMNIKMIKNNKTSLSILVEKQNGGGELSSDNEDSTEEIIPVKKRKNIDINKTEDPRKLKKHKKENRMKESSVGLENGISFIPSYLPDEGVTQTSKKKQKKERLKNGN